MQPTFMSMMLIALNRTAGYSFLRRGTAQTVFRAYTGELAPSTCSRDNADTHVTLQDLNKCDLLIVLGTSLQVRDRLLGRLGPLLTTAPVIFQVHPFASLVGRVSESCARILINRELVGQSRAPWDSGFAFDKDSRDLFWKGDTDEGCRQLAADLGWDVSLPGSSHRSWLTKNVLHPDRKIWMN